MSGSQELITAFLDNRREADQIALWTFGDDRVLERFPFGMGWYLLPRVLETLEPWSTTALYDVVQMVPDILEKARHHRRAAILLTDGVDNASSMSAEEATAVAHRLETPIYVLGVEPPPPMATPDGPSYEEILTLIADRSGGHYRRIPRAEEMPEVVDELLKELSSRGIFSPLSPRESVTRNGVPSKSLLMGITSRRVRDMWGRCRSPIRSRSRARTRSRSHR